MTKQERIDLCKKLSDVHLAASQMLEAIVALSSPTEYDAELSDLFMMGLKVASDFDKKFYETLGKVNNR